MVKFPGGDFLAVNRTASLPGSAHRLRPFPRGNHAGNTKRGRGLGKVLVSMAVKYAYEVLGAIKVSLGVFENNPSAIHCYETAGFHRVSLPETESYECLDEMWNCIEMEQLRR